MSFLDKLEDFRDSVFFGGSAYDDSTDIFPLGPGEMCLTTSVHEWRSVQPHAWRPRLPTVLMLPSTGEGEMNVPLLDRSGRAVHTAPSIGGGEYVSRLAANPEYSDASLETVVRTMPLPLVASAVAINPVIRWKVWCVVLNMRDEDYRDICTLHLSFVHIGTVPLPLSLPLRTGDTIVLVRATAQGEAGPDLYIVSRDQMRNRGIFRSVRSGFVLGTAIGGASVSPLLGTPTTPPRPIGLSVSCREGMLASDSAIDCGPLSEVPLRWDSVHERIKGEIH